MSFLGDVVGAVTLGLVDIDGGGGGGGAQSTSTADSSSNWSSNTQTSNTDNRIATDSGLVAHGDYSNFDQSTRNDNSITSTDSSNRSTWADNSIHSADSSNRSVDNSITSTDSSNRSTWADNSIHSADSSNRSTSNTTSTTNNITDGGAVASATAALSTGFSDLLSAAKDMFSTTSNNSKTELQSILGANSEYAKNIANAYQGSSEKIAGAYQTAASEKSGSLDNKTILLLGLGVVAAFALTKMKA